MNEIRPFHGTLYNTERIPDLARVLTPPYDIITPAMQNELYNADPHNFIRIDFGRKNDGDTATDNVYSRAHQTFREWKHTGVFRHDPASCFYLLKQEFEITSNGRRRKLSRTGFFGLYRIQDFSMQTIMPHEKTQSGPKEDRYMLTKACKAYFSAVFSIYDDPEMTVEKLFSANAFGAPCFSYTDYQGAVNTLYRSPVPEVNAGIAAMMANKLIFIADGHHRYDTAARIKRELGKRDISPYDYTLMYFSNNRDTGMVILPTYRVLSNTSYSLNDLLDFLKKYFTVTEKKHDELFSCLDAMKSSREKHPLLLALKDRLLLLETEDMARLDKLFPPGLHAVLRELDVNILFHCIAKGFFGLTEDDLKNQKGISYVKDPAEALSLAASGKAGAVVLLNPTEIDQIRKAAELNETMPQKSTYFYPKIPSGAVIYELNDDN